MSTIVKVRKLKEHEKKICYHSLNNKKKHKVKGGEVVVFIDEFGEWSDVMCKDHAIEYFNHKIKKSTEVINRILKVDKNE